MYLRWQTIPHPYFMTVRTTAIMSLILEYQWVTVIVSVNQTMYGMKGGDVYACVDSVPQEMSFIRR